MRFGKDGCPSLGKDICPSLPPVNNCTLSDSKAHRGVIKSLLAQKGVEAVGRDIDILASGASLRIDEETNFYIGGGQELEDGHQRPIQLNTHTRHKQAQSEWDDFFDIKKKPPKKVKVIEHSFETVIYQRLADTLINRVRQLRQPQNQQLTYEYECLEI